MLFADRTDIPPVANSSEIYVSDAGVPISVDLLRARFRGFKKFNVTELPYFSIMEFGGGPPSKYKMTCLPAPTTQQQQQQQQQQPNGMHAETINSRRALAEHSIDQMGPIAIQKCASPEPGAQLLWTKLPGDADADAAAAGGAAAGAIRLQLSAPPAPAAAAAAASGLGMDACSGPPLCLTAVATTR